MSKSCLNLSITSFNCMKYLSGSTANAQSEWFGRGRRMLAWFERVRSGELLKDLFLFLTRLFDPTAPSPIFSLGLRYFDGTMQCAILENHSAGPRLLDRFLPNHSPFEAVELVIRDSPFLRCSTRRAALPWSIPSGDKTPSFCLLF